MTGRGPVAKGIRMRRWMLSACLLAVLAGCGGEPPTDPQYVAAIDSWHAERIERLRSDTGWLTLVGLHELRPGLQLIGSAPDADVRLIDKAPPRVGLLDVSELGLVFEAEPDAGVTVLMEGRRPPARRLLVHTDAEGAPTLLACGSLVFHVIDRQGRYFLRVKDRESEVLRDFEGIDRFPVQARWRVRARLEGEPGTLDVPNVLGQQSQEPTPGVLVFELEDGEHRLVPTGRRGQDLFLVFGDATNGRSTYGGGRFLSVDAADSTGIYTLDFNRATNPPCVFTPFATCPLPAPRNRLETAIEAGERVWGDHH